MEGDHVWAYQPWPWCRWILYVNLDGQALEVDRYWRTKTLDDDMRRLSILLSTQPHLLRFLEERQ